MGGAGYLAQRRSRSPLERRGELLEGKRTGVEELDPPHGETDIGALQVDFWKRSGGNDIEVGTLLPEVTQKPDRSRGVLHLVDEEKCRWFAGICITGEAGCLEDPGPRPVSVEQFAIDALFQIKGEVLAVATAEQVDGCRLADLSSPTDD